MSLKTEFNLDNWVEAINCAAGSYSLNALLREAVDIIHDPLIHNAFLERIHFLQKESCSMKEFTSLDRVRFQVEGYLSSAKVEELRKEATFEQLRNVIDSERFVAIWFNHEGQICYRIGPMKCSELSYIEKLISTINTDLIKKNTFGESI